MAIISQKTWDKFKEEEKDEFRKIYNEILTSYQDAQKQGYIERADDIFDRLLQMEIFFGKENLYFEPKIKIWKDIEVKREDEDCYCCAIENTLSKSYFDDKLRNKLIATFKISKLIELGYGGMITEEEWKTERLQKWCVIVDYKDPAKLSNYMTDCYYHFIAFHTPEQRKEFMSYPENRQLIYDYYML